MEKRRPFFDKYYDLMLLMVFTLVWLWSMWNPASQENWFLENKAIFVSVPIIYFLFVWYIRFSKLSFALITIFAMLHVIGAHYNYGSVPFGSIIGDIFKSKANMYDKFVHFSFGFLIVYPLRELFLRIAKMKGFWSYLVPFMAITTLGTFYEIYEWVTVLQYDPQVGYLFIGGNDPFDTTKDLFSAVMGSFVTLGVVALIEWARSRDTFMKKMKKSFVRDRRTFPEEDRHIHETLERIH